MRVQKRLITVQPSEFTDHITEDGEELTKLPYPFSGLEDGTLYPAGSRGKVVRLIGFADDSSRQQVDLWWRYGPFVDDPQLAVGKYLVIENENGSMAALETAVRDVSVREVWVDVPDIVGGGTTITDGKNRIQRPEEET